MRRGGASTLVILSVLLALTGQAMGASKRIKSKVHAGLFKIEIAGRTSVYYRATADTPLEVKVKGPTPIRVLSRYLYGEDEEAGPVTYSLTLSIDGVEVRTMTEDTYPSDSARRQDGGEIGTLERAVAQIPEGDHTVTIRPVDEEVELGFRIFRGLRKTGGSKWISYSPESYARAVRLHATDAELTYYRFTKSEPVVADLIGPLRLRIRTRLDFAPETGYTQAYVVSLILDGEPWKNYRLESRTSHTSIYPDLPEITPGRGRDINVKLPSGEHRLEILLSGTTAEGASLRILIPEKELLKKSG
ncbi:MAG: hypothetical protein GF355_02805 [Candidatus Eisenbacteria bacterium]|nr:hypothetical protein [Candidatus Eisenbacteria bacterium]